MRQFPQSNNTQATLYLSPFLRRQFDRHFSSGQCLSRLHTLLPPVVHPDRLHCCVQRAASGVASLTPAQKYHPKTQQTNHFILYQRNHDRKGTCSPAAGRVMKSLWNNSSRLTFLPKTLSLSWLKGILYLLEWAQEFCFNCGTKIKRKSGTSDKYFR